MELIARMLFGIFLVSVGTNAFASESALVRHVLPPVSDVSSRVPGEITYDQDGHGIKAKFSATEKALSTASVGDSGFGYSSLMASGSTVRIFAGSTVVLNDGTRKKITSDTDFSISTVHGVSPFVNGWNYLWYRVWSMHADSLYVTAATDVPVNTVITDPGSFGYLGSIYVTYMSPSPPVASPFKKMGFSYEGIVGSPFFIPTPASGVPISEMFPPSASHYRVMLSSEGAGNQFTACYTAFGESRCGTGIMEVPGGYALDITASPTASSLTTLYRTGYEENPDDYRALSGGRRKK